MSEQQSAPYPYNEDAERAVLSCLLQYDAPMSEVADILSPDDFYVSSRRHPDIYRAMLGLYEQASPITPVSVEHAIGRDSDLFSYLISLSEDVSFAHRAAYFAGLVQDCAKRRAVIHAGERMVADAYAESDAAAVLFRAEQSLSAIGQSGRRGEWQSVADLWPTYLDRFSVLESQHGGLSGLRTHFHQFDYMTGGLQRQDLIVLAGRPGTGKTSLALTVGYNAAFQDDHNVAIFSLEMSKDELFGRLVAMRSGVNSQKLKTPWLMSKDEKMRVHTAILQLDNPHLFVEDTQGLSTTDLRSRAKRLHAAHPLDLVIVDYLQLMRAYNDKGKRIDNRQQEIAEISMALKALSKELDVPVLALAQLNREVESRSVKIPQLSDLRESGQIEQDSDIVLFIYREELYNPKTERPGQADLIIAKNRDGATGEVALHFNAPLTLFSNLDTHTGGQP